MQINAVYKNFMYVQLGKPIMKTKITNHPKSFTEFYCIIQIVQRVDKSVQILLEKSDKK